MGCIIPRNLKNIGITIGTASIGLGFIVIILDAILGENIGIGTILNMIFIGIFMDLIIFTNLVPKSNNVIQGIVMLIIGMALAGDLCLLREKFISQHEWLLTCKLQFDTSLFYLYVK